MNSRERFINALAAAVSDAYYSQGEIYLSTREIETVAKAEGTPDQEVRAVLRLLDDQGLLMQQEGGHSYSDGLGLVLRYEKADRPLFWERNKLRREILTVAASSYDEGQHDLRYEDDGERFVDAPWAEAFSASRTLEEMGLLEVQPFMGHNFRVGITSMGYELQRDFVELSQALPINAAEDEAAGENVARDAMAEAIRNVEELLAKREWTGAERELERGDAQYGAGHWADAVREYYAALESGLKHRLDEHKVNYGSGAALKDLAKLVAAENLIPVNYQALFGFIDSIRSPRSHGAGGEVEEVEIGRAEALLVANHVRALLLYLGHRGP